MNKENIKVSHEIKIILRDLYNQIEYELQEDYDDEIQKILKENRELKEIIQEVKELKEFWFKGGTYIVPVEVMNNIFGMVEELESGDSNE